MEELKLSNKHKEIIQDFIKGLRDIYQEGLISVILYGSAASGEFIDKHSNLNLLVVLDNTDLENLKKVSKMTNKFKMITPLFFSEVYINGSTDIFPIEFLDIQENYSVLHGKDILKGINIDIGNLRFQCEHELKSRLINLRQLYLKINKTALKDLLFRYFTSILHISRNILRIKGKSPPYRKEEVLQALSSEFKIDLKVWMKILSAKNKEIRLNRVEKEELFTKFIKDLENLVDIVDKL